MEPACLATDWFPRRRDCSNGNQDNRREPVEGDELDRKLVLSVQKPGEDYEWEKENGPKPAARCESSFIMSRSLL